MKKGLIVCNSFFVEYHWKILVDCEFLVCELVVGHSFDLTYIFLKVIVEIPLMSAFSGWVGRVSSWLHVCWFKTFRSSLKRSESRDFLFQFANHSPYKQSLREAKIIFSLVWVLSFFIFVLSFCHKFELLACIGCHIYIQKYHKIFLWLYWKWKFSHIRIALREK